MNYRQNKGDNKRKGFCFCPKCDYHQEHRKGLSCQKQRCPRCGVKMILKIVASDISENRNIEHKNKYY